MDKARETFEGVSHGIELRLYPGATLHVPKRRQNKAGQTRNRLNSLDNVGEGREVSLTLRMVGWGGRDRTCEYRYQKAVPYHLATPHQGISGP